MSGRAREYRTDGSETVMKGHFNSVICPPFICLPLLNMRCMCTCACASVCEHVLLLQLRFSPVLPSGDAVHEANGTETEVFGLQGNTQYIVTILARNGANTGPGASHTFTTNFGVYQPTIVARPTTHDKNRTMGKGSARSRRVLKRISWSTKSKALLASRKQPKTGDPL